MTLMTSDADDVLVPSRLVTLVGRSPPAQYRIPRGSLVLRRSPVENSIRRSAFSPVICRPCTGWSK